MALIGLVVLLSTTKGEGKEYPAWHKAMTINSVDKNVHEEIWTRRLVIVDKDGVGRGGFTTNDENSPLFFLTDKEGNQRLTLVANEDAETSLSFYNKGKESPQIELSLSPDGSSSLWLTNNGGINISVDENGWPSVLMMKLGEGFLFDVSKENTALFLKKGSMESQIIVKSNFSGFLLRDGEQPMALLATSPGGASLVLNKDGKVIWSAP